MALQKHLISHFGSRRRSHKQPTRARAHANTEKGERGRERDKSSSAGLERPSKSVSLRPNSLVNAAPLLLSLSACARNTCHTECLRRRLLLFSVQSFERGDGRGRFVKQAGSAACDGIAAASRLLTSRSTPPIQARGIPAFCRFRSTTAVGD